MCVANSARSQMAEGIAKTLYPNIEFKSAGSIPSKVNPLAIQVMEEINIDITDHFSKDFESLENNFIDNLDYVIPLCKEEVCPLLNSDAIVIPMPLEDPASENFSDNKLNKFREVRDLIKYKLKELKTNFGD
jgi:arsenate reductase|tara:strand:- start:203 stop:598 length:396 start_codon:yes stop_codon:yes gene_type:complete